MAENELNINGYSDEELDDEQQFRPLVKLKDGFLVDDLLTPKAGVTFEVDGDTQTRVENTNEYSYFGNEEFMKKLSLDCINPSNVDSEGEDCEDDEQTPFSTIALKMTKIVDDAGVLKKIVKPGSGAVVPKNAMVTVHYNGYLEYIDEPFDSTRLRNRPHHFRLGTGVVIPGLEVAVSSMKKGEKSQFLIKPHFAFGKMGCKPRIPEDAELLFEVELVDFVDNAAAFDFDHLTEEEKKELSFDIYLKAAKAEHVSGNNEFQNGHVRRALARYRKAERILDASTVSSDTDEERLKRLFLKLVTNQAVCHIKLKEPERVCIQCNKALAMNPQNPKALFLHGKALIMLGDYSRAGQYLIKARRIEPNNKEISAELERLDSKRSKAAQDNVAMCRRMFGDAAASDSSDPKKDIIPNDNSYQSVIRRRLKAFVEDSDAQEASFPSDVTQAERDFLESEAGKLGLDVSVPSISSALKIRVIKRKPAK